MRVCISQIWRMVEINMHIKENGSLQDCACIHPFYAFCEYDLNLKFTFVRLYIVEYNSTVFGSCSRVSD